MRPAPHSSSLTRPQLSRGHAVGFTEKHQGLTSTRLLLLSVAAICVVALVFGLASPNRARLLASVSGWLTEDSEDSRDQRLLVVATNALGDRSGSVIIMDPQTGRIRAVVNSKIAFEEAYRPGSTIKPFTTLAALRSGILDERSQSLCREQYAHEEFHTTCSHPRDLPPLNPTEAIAYSCNYYFGKVGERLTEPALAATLDDFGFGKKSGINRGVESPGKLRHGEWRPQSAMGEGDYLETTPIQLLNAYATLVNGGHLFKPRTDRAKGFVPELKSDLAINAEHRSLILNGLRGAVRYGTAESAGLYSLPSYTFGKTGTATELNGFRMQGWFVGFGAALSDNSSAGKAGGAELTQLAPAGAELGVLVFLSRGHGAEAAEVARPILAEYARMSERYGDAATRRRGDKEAVGALSGDSPLLRVPASPRPRGAVVRVHLSSENITRALPLEDYVRGVVAAEGSTESEIEALKALAIASRTYTLKNSHRHARDGYDFCTTTHCQRYRQLDSTTGTPSAIAAAVASTSGEVLLGRDAQIADSYFSASCGGATANLTTLWGGTAPPYLRGVTDNECVSEPHANWTDTISQVQLLKAFKTDARTNVGDRLLEVDVLRTDKSGRAELIALAGDRRLTVRGWDFKIIVGRALGWNLLKSSRFSVARSGSNFVFRGSGFGHGLGLCQEGAHVMARRGAGYRQILAKYFPGTDVAEATDMANWNTSVTQPVSLRSSVTQTVSLRSSVTQTISLRSFPKIPAASVLAAESFTQPRASADLLWNHHADFEINGVSVNSRFRPAARRRTLASEDFRINYPGNLNQREVEGLLTFLQASRKSLIARVAAAGVTAQFPALEIFINETTGDFVGRTRQPPWAAAATRNNRIELQPLATLKRRRILETTLRHELVHTLVDILGRGQTPRWLAEGLALHFADEGRLIARYEPRKRLSIAAIETQLGEAKSANEMRAAYAAAYREVKRLINYEGETNVWRRVAK